jgi:DNA polymerase-3 subunit epsilon
MRLALRRGPDVPYTRAPLPGGRTPWRDARLCALDFELTGLDPQLDEIISFGVVPITDGRVRVSAAVTGLVRPQREIGEASIRVHGIRAADLASAPPLSQALSTLLDAIAGQILVVHTAAVERTFLGRALRERGMRLRGPIIDTEELGRLWLAEREGKLRARVALGDLARELGLPAENAHDALGDALTTAQVFIALASHLDAAHPETVASLARVRRRLDGLRMFHGH